MIICICPLKCPRAATHSVMAVSQFMHSHNEAKTLYTMSIVAVATRKVVPSLNRQIRLFIVDILHVLMHISKLTVQLF